MKIANVCTLIVLPFLLGATISSDRVSVFVEYHHEKIVVHYSLDCKYEQTSWLESPPGQTPNWRVEVTPHRRFNELVMVSAKVFENGNEELHTHLQLKVGGDAAKLTTDPEAANPHSITIEATSI